jgi:hypothetical protein
VVRRYVQNGGTLFAQSQLANECYVAICVFGFKVIKKLAAATNHAQQTTSAVMVFAMLLEVWREFVDACSEQSYLHFGAACIGGRARIIFDDLSLFFLSNHVFDLNLFVPNGLTCAHRRNYKARAVLPYAKLTDYDIFDTHPARLPLLFRANVQLKHYKLAVRIASFVMEYSRSFVRHKRQLYRYQKYAH